MELIMIVLNDAVRARLRMSKVDAFVAECTAKLKQMDPFHTKTAGDAAVEETVRLGLARGRKYGITETSSVTLYAQIMVLLGSFFDIDPMYPWAGEWLNAPRDGDTQTDTMNRLRGGLINTLGKISGPDGAGSLAFLSRMDSFLTDPAPDVAVTADTIQMLATRLCPERAELGGPDAIAAIVTNAMREADAARVTALKPVTSMAVLGVVYGLHVFDDPLHQWARDTLDKAKEHATPNQLVLRAGRVFFARSKAHVTARLAS